MSNIWDEDKEDFRDVPDEVAGGQSAYSPPIPAAVALRQQASKPAPQPEEKVEMHEADLNLDFLEEEDYSEVLNDANLRIEQGRLYQMIMNHDLFQDMDVDPRAVANVTRNIRKFARESMEIMLGMRQEKMMKDYANFNAQLANPFNDLEVEILKKIASKATNGATESPEANNVAVAIKAPPKRQTINPIGNSAPKKAQPQKLPSKTQAPIQRKRLDPTTEQILAEEGVPREALEEDYKPIGKPLHELTPQELEERNRQAAARRAKHKTVKSASALPMATQEQQEMLAAQAAARIGGMQGMSVLLEKMKNMPPSKV